MGRQKLVVLGIDGASWNLLDRWIEEGELPNLKKVKENGFSGNLESTYPYVTFPAWKTYSTGRNPAKLDVYYWFTFDEEAGKLDFANSRDFKAKEIWDYLEQKEISSGVINMPSTYPAKDLENGFMVSGTLASQDDFASPEDLEESLKEQDYRVNPEAEKNTEKWRDEIKDLIKLRTDIALDKLDEVDFMHLTFFYTDKMQHNYWDGEETLEVWREVDRQIGRLLGEDINLLIMSDHGLQKMDKFFYINSWLQENDYLVRKTDAGDKAQKVGLNRDRLFSAVKLLGLQDLARKLVPKSIRRMIPREDGVVEETDVVSKIDFENSKAFALSEGPLYIIEENVEDIDLLKRDLKSGLESFKNGEIVKEVIDGSEIYRGEYSGTAPDLFLDQAPGIEIRMDLSDKVIDEECGASSWIANHRQEGIHAAYGPDFTEGEKDISIYDLMPTILNYYDVQIPSDVDGQVRNELFADGSEAKMDKAVDDLDI